MENAIGIGVGRLENDSTSFTYKACSKMDQHRYDIADHNLRELAQHALAGNPYFAGRRLRVEQLGSEIILKGVVSTYYQKQLAQESVRTVDGIEGIRNEIEVMSIYWSPPNEFSLVHCHSLIWGLTAGR